MDKACNRGRSVQGKALTEAQGLKPLKDLTILFLKRITLTQIVFTFELMFHSTKATKAFFLNWSFC